MAPLSCSTTLTAFSKTAFSDIARNNSCCFNLKWSEIRDVLAKHCGDAFSQANIMCKVYCQIYKSNKNTLYSVWMQVVKYIYTNANTVFFLYLSISISVSVLLSTPSSLHLREIYCAFYTLAYKTFLTLGGLRFYMQKHASLLQIKLNSA